MIGSLCPLPVQLKREQLVKLPHTKSMFARIHVDQLAAELHSLQLQTISLFGFGARSQFYRPSGSDDAMPRQGVDRVAAQETRNGAVVERITGSRGNSAVSTDLADGDRDDDSTKSIIADVIRLQTIDDNSAFQFLFVEKTKPIARNLETFFSHLTID